MGLKRKLKTITDFQINYNDHLIKSQSRIKYLCIDRHQNVFGERTANTVIQKVNSRLRFIHRKANCLSSETRRPLSMELLQCHLDYPCSSWYAGMSQALKHKLQVAQNKTIHLITGVILKVWTQEQA